jgi:class 3 adenylate cyclase
MQCPKCHSECPPEFDFCPRCAAPLQVTCPQCGFRAPADFQFCPKCATALAAPTIAAERDMQAMLSHAIQRLIPKELAERLQATRGQVSTERRLVTILFCDVKGSTAMGESLDPEEMLEIMKGAFEFLIPPVYRHEGTLAQLMGDAILAFFGAPIAHEDDPERAIRAGLEITAEAAEYAEKLEREKGIQGFGVRVGINTGLVVVGELGSDLRVEYTAVGDAINLAARMEQNAPVGGVLITHDTYRHVRGVFDVLPQPPLVVKGKSEPVQTYLVQRAKLRAFRLETRGVEGVETRTIGREAELQTLQNAYFDAVEASETRVAIVSGDAGVGKSRLLYEFVSWAELRPERFWLFKGRARAETQAVPYAVLRDLFANRFEILDSDSATTALSKFRAGVAGFLEPDKADLVGHLAGFDLRAAGSQAVSNLLGDASFAQLATAYLLSYLRAMAAQQPLLMLLEDLHWADDSSLNLIDHIVTEIPAARLVLLCLARPALFERRPNWGEGRAAYVHLTLRPLSRRQSRALVGEILKKADSVPDDLCNLVTDGAEGNPFYVEELIKMLIEEAVIVTSEEPWRVQLSRLRALHVPPTLTGVLQARLDSLPREARDVLQRASVVGRVFWDGAVAALAPVGAPSPDAEQVAPMLAVVRERELVFRREQSTFFGAQEYIFKHGILHDVTYETVLLRLRRLYHKQVAQWLEANAGERVGEYAALMAEHYERAGEGALAAHWLQRVASDALDTGASHELVRACERALALLPEDQKAARAEFLARLGEGRGSLGDVAAAERDLAAALALAREVNELKTAAYAATALSQLAYWEGKLGEMQAPAAEALELARAAGDKYAEAFALLWLGNAVHLHQHDIGLGRRYLEKSMALFQEVGRGWGVAACLNNMGEMSRDEGDLAAAARYYEQSLVVRRQSGHRRGVAITLFNLGEVAAAQNDLAAAVRYHQEGLAVAEEIGHKMVTCVCRGGLGYSAAASGDVTSARRYFQRALSEAVAARGLTSELYALVGFARLKVLAGEPVRAAEWLGLAMSHPANDTDAQQRGQALLADLRATLPAAELEAVLERGAKLGLDEVVAEILGETEDVTRRT